MSSSALCRCVFMKLFEKSSGSLKTHRVLSNSFVRHFRNRPTAGIGRTYGLTGVESSRHLKRKKEVKNALLQENISCYDTLKFKITGYDIVLVESFTKIVHHLLQQLNYKIDELYAEPTFEQHIKNMKTSLTANVDDLPTVYSLSYHTRVIKITDLPTHAKPVLIHMMMYFVPQSVTFEISPFVEADEEKRHKKRVALQKAMEELKMIQKA
uniref:39S ribosomal protein L48, mitochondrial-like n=1 Tax=Phallusia mammillata TaxID=59560 RepID=A0A6F9DKL6_9ASCI|nr:39S ribosomal protein L48, mitochondrial-like [Phallusia mammillata]